MDFSNYHKAYIYLPLASLKLEIKSHNDPVRPSLGLEFVFIPRCRPE